MQILPVDLTALISAILGAGEGGPPPRTQGAPE